MEVNVKKFAAMFDKIRFAGTCGVAFGLAFQEIAASARTCQATISELLFCSLPRHPVTLSSIRAAAKTQRAEDWFWRLVFAGVVCDFLYLGWLALRLLRAK